MNDLGRIIYSRGRKEQGIVIAESERYCAVCGRHECYIVKWNDGKKTKPCSHGVKLVDNDLEIM